jgi:formate dehydrogenase assembly factor FdhD
MTVVVAQHPRPIFNDVARQVWRRAATAVMPAQRKVPEEAPVAFVYQGASYAVMMATRQS